MAACVPARAGQYVLEGGCGAGAGLLCLAARVPGVRGIGLECDSHTVALGQVNVGDNGFDTIRILQATLPAMPDDPYLSGPGVRRIDHAFANPPWHDHASTPSPLSRRDRARRLPRAGLAHWVSSLSAQLRHHGTLTLAVPATLLDHAISSMGDSRLGAIPLSAAAPCRGRRQPSGGYYGLPLLAPAGRCGKDRADTGTHGITHPCATSAWHCAASCGWHLHAGRPCRPA